MISISISTILGMERRVMYVVKIQIRRREPPKSAVVCVINHITRTTTTDTRIIIASGVRLTTIVLVGVLVKYSVEMQRLENKPRLLANVRVYRVITDSTMIDAYCARRALIVLAGVIEPNV
jgi:hypothetical protein